jgi:hypothetical protein
LGGFEHGVDLFDVMVRDAAALVFVEDDFAEFFEVGAGNGVEGGPFFLGLEAGQESPVAAVFVGADETEFALVGAVAPFVFDHGSEAWGAGLLVIRIRKWTADCGRNMNSTI